MPDSVRERVIANVVTTLQGITEANGYEFDMAEVTRIPQGVLNFASATYPKCLVIEDSEDIQEGVPTYFTTRMLHLSLACWAWQYFDLSQAVNKLLANVEKALSVDHTRGGVAVDTDFISNTTILANDVIPYGGVEIKLDIHYRHKTGDPYTL